MSGTDNFVADAAKVFETEASALLAVRARLDDSFSEAVRALLAAPTKVVFMGVGKSGLVAEKIASSLRSVGVPAVYVSAAEAAHGDLGVYGVGDPTVMVSKSGGSSELLKVVPSLKALESTIVAIVGKAASPLADAADIVLNAEVDAEADPLGLVPTSSTTAALVMGDALVAATMQARSFTRDQFASNHPGGMLGRSLTITVERVMHPTDKVATVSSETPMTGVVEAMSERNLGCAVVVDGNARMLGIITDGDVRRALRGGGDVREMSAESVMTKNPAATRPNALLIDAVRLMEQRESQIAVLPVIEDSNVLLGVLRLHDILRLEVS